LQNNQKVIEVVAKVRGQLAKYIEKLDFDGAVFSSEVVALALMAFAFFLVIPIINLSDFRDPFRIRIFSLIIFFILGVIAFFKIMLRWQKKIQLDAVEPLNDFCLDFVKTRRNYTKK
jgi:hypothetical protein